MRPFVLALLLAAVPALAGGPPIVTVSTGFVLLKDDVTVPVDPRTRYVKFKSRTKLDDPAHQVDMPDAGSAGDPTSAGATGGGGTLTVYNAAGTGEVFTIDLPAERWLREGNPTPRTYRFADGDGPIFRVIVRPYKIYIRGGTAAWGYTLDELVQGAVAVRLTLGTGITWCATAGPKPPAETNDRAGKFLGAKTPAPATCPPLPGE